jgi:hypothetical protein
MEELRQKVQECIDAGGDRVNELDCWVDDFSGNIVINAENLIDVIDTLNRIKDEG